MRTNDLSHSSGVMCVLSFCSLANVYGGSEGFCVIIRSR